MTGVSSERDTPLQDPITWTRALETYVSISKIRHRGDENAYLSEHLALDIDHGLGIFPFPIKLSPYMEDVLS